MNENVNQAEKFSWQEGYGAFSVNVSIVKDTIRYIENQKKHHQKSSYKDEYSDFLKKHCIAYDEHYLGIMATRRGTVTFGTYPLQ